MPKDPDTDEQVPIRRAKTQQLDPESIFTGERDEKLDPARGKITNGLLFLLGGALILHSVLTFWASYGSVDAAKNIAAVFNIWVPVISGLVSSAITWFFTRQK